MHGVVREHNVHAAASQPLAGDGPTADCAMSAAELEDELRRREFLLQQHPSEPGAATDQWRVYSEIVAGLQDEGRLLRIFVQASAGTGKSFLLETF